MTIQVHLLNPQFQHTAARRRLGPESLRAYFFHDVSTHSRPKAAGVRWLPPVSVKAVSTHSRPKAAGFRIKTTIFAIIVSTHSRPKAAGKSYCKRQIQCSCFNTQPPEGGWSTKFANAPTYQSFNTQPPEGGWRRVNW